MCALIHWPIRDEFAKFHTGMTVKENNEKKTGLVGIPLTAVCIFNGKLIVNRFWNVFCQKFNFQLLELVSFSVSMRTHTVQCNALSGSYAHLLSGGNYRSPSKRC